MNDLGISPGCLHTLMDSSLPFFQLKTQGRGEILVSLCYQPASNRITAVVLKASNLPKMDITGLSGKRTLCY